ncbi:MAG TPA: hypothetical protein VE439_03490 [Anaerolineae bacterium]|nr:hypothetical protein [Anaerolineae bacterium]
MAEIGRLLKERELLYRELADVRVDTGDKNPQEVAELIIKELGTRGYL